MTAIPEMNSTADTGTQSATETVSFTPDANDKAGQFRLMAAKASTSAWA